MTSIERLVGQHVSEYESRLKHIDELYQRAQDAAIKIEDNVVNSELGKYQRQRADLARHTDKIKKMPIEHWREDMIQASGPMGVWDILAQKLEDLIERLEK
jgi:hypothetical protein